MRNNEKKAFWINRPLLTDTLPYETPVIFSNDRFYYALSRKHPENIDAALARIIAPVKSYTIPYSYSIRKDDTRTTLLGVIHPLLQVEFCEFYFRSEGALLWYCSRSEYSIRHPTAVAAVYVEQPTVDSAAASKLGQVEISLEEGEPELDRMVSYFVYGRYNLLSKFYESADFVRLEKKFSLLRHLDISKCFYGIYTHTVSWAAKDKKYAKTNRNGFSFEAEFDKLMQRSNYNETNGIVVGPEISRIFAEVILQDIDRKVAARLREHQLFENRDYSVRRYVDDYSIFANTAANLSKIEQCLRLELEVFKLYLNDSKRQDFGRPFISDLSISRSELTALMSRARAIFDSDQWRQGQSLVSNDRRVLQSLIHELRIIVRKNGIQFGHISGWAIGSLRVMVGSIHSILKIAPTNPGAFDDWYQAISVVLSCSFYLASVDVRVRTTYSLCQILNLIYEKRSIVPAGFFEQIDYTVASEIGSLIISTDANQTDSHERENVELYNLLICGSYILKEKFSRNSAVAAIVKNLNKKHFSYFRFITAKFCFLRDPALFASDLEAINVQVESKVNTQRAVNEDAESYMLMCDFFSSPDVSPIRKKALYDRVYGGSIALKTMENLTNVIGFVDWDAMKIEHTLKRKQLRPVYAVA
jgi:hypothetical protein